MKQKHQWRQKWHAKCCGVIGWRQVHAQICLQHLDKSRCRQNPCLHGVATDAYALRRVLDKSVRRSATFHGKYAVHRVSLSTRYVRPRRAGLQSTDASAEWQPHTLSYRLQFSMRRSTKCTAFCTAVNSSLNSWKRRPAYRRSTTCISKYRTERSAKGKVEAGCAII